MAPLLAILSAPGCRTLRAPTARSTAAHATTARPTRLEACFSAALVAVALIFVIPSTVRIANDLRRTPPNACFSNLPKAGCVKVNDDLEQAVTFLQAHSAQSLPIFVGLQRHDMIYTSDMLFYFLADRPSLTRYQLLEPGVATTAAVQDGIIADLATHAAEQIVLVNMPPPANPEPNLSSVSSRVHNLDDFIRTHYAREATFGRWSIWQNSRQAGPAGSASHG